MAEHQLLTDEFGLPVYFKDPHSPWQRGSNENMNGLLRQYFPKGPNLARHTPEQLQLIAARLISRPRKTLAWATPATLLETLPHPTNNPHRCDVRWNPLRFVLAPPG